MVLNILVKPGYLVVENIIQDEVGHESYGLYYALFSLCSLFSVFYDLGLSHYSSRNISRDNSLFKSLFPSLFFTRLMVLLVFPFIMAGIGYIMGYEEKALWWLFLLSVSANLFHFALFFRSKLQAFQFFKLDSLASVLQKLLLIIIVFVLLHYGITIEKFLITEVFTHILVFLILYVAIIRLFGHVKLKFDPKKVATIVKGAFPFAIMTLLYSLNEKVDAVMLERLSTAYHSGIYAGAVRLFDAGMMYPWVVMPMFFAKFAAYDDNVGESENLIRVGTIVMFLPMLLVALIFMFAPDPLFVLFKNSSVEELDAMKLALAILAGSFMIHGISVVMGTYLNASGYVGKVNRLVGLCVIVNIALNFFGIPRFGVYAAATTTGISTLLLFIGYLYLIRTNTSVKLNRTVMVRLLGLLVLAGLIGYLASNHLSNPFVIWVVLLVGIVALFFIMGLARKSIYTLEEH